MNSQNIPDIEADEHDYSTKQLDIQVIVANEYDYGTNFYKSNKT